MSIMKIKEQFPNGKIVSNGKEYVTICPNCKKQKLYISVIKDIGYCFYCQKPFFVNGDVDFSSIRLSEKRNEPHKLEDRGWVGLPKDHLFVDLFNKESNLIGGIGLLKAQEYFLNRGFSEKDSSMAGIKFCYYGNKYKDRIIIPHTFKGIIYKFCARTTDNNITPKVLYPPKSVFPQEDFALFGLDKCIESKTKEVFLCEGQFDAIALGIGKAISFGGASIKSTTLSLLLSYFDSFLLTFDNDKAGENTTNKYYSLFSRAGKKVKIVSYDKKWKDPAEIKQETKQDIVKFLKF